MTDETANLWLKKQIKIRRESRKKRIQNFIQQEMEFVLPKTKQNLEHYLGDFTEINANNLSLKLKYYSEDFSKREIYSREINPNANFFLPPAIELENLEKNTLSLEKVNLNNKKVLFHSSLSQSQEKFQSNVHRRLKTFMKEYDKNKLDDLKSKTFSLHSKKKPSSSLLKLNNHIKIQTLSQNNSGNRELEIPFILRNTNPNSNKNNFTNAKTNSNIINLNNIKKYVSDKNNCHNIKDSEYDLNYKRNLDPVENLLRKNSLSNQKKREWKLDQISPKRNDIKIKFDLLKEIPPNFKNQLLQKEENFEKSRTGWLNFKLQENRGKTYSCSGSFVGKKINSFEEKEKNNKILLESLKTQQGKKNKTIAFSSFHVIQRKYQGNRYTTNLFKNIC